MALGYQVADPRARARPQARNERVPPRSKEHPEDENFPGLLILRPEGRIFFANAGRIGQKVRAFLAEASAKVLVLDLSAVFDLEYTALKMLTEAEKRARGEGVDLWLAGLNPSVLAMIQRSPLGEALGRERMAFDEKTAAERKKSARSRARGVSGPTSREQLPLRLRELGELLLVDLRIMEVERRRACR